MKFNLAVAGYLPGDKEICRKIDGLIKQINESFSFEEGSGALQINTLMSPEYSCGYWTMYAHDKGLPIHGYTLSSDSRNMTDCVRTVCIDSSVRMVVGESLCNQADLLLLVWNENVTEMDGAAWELIRTAQRIKAPCIWISSKTGKIYRARESCFEPYLPEHLNDLCRDMMTDVITPTIHNEKKSVLISLGAYLHNKFLRRHKAQSSVMNAEKDALLTDDFKEESNPEGEKLRKDMLAAFRQFDSAAVEYASRYHAVMYWRAILPSITTILLAVSSYIGTIFNLIPNGGDALFRKAELIAGIGFLAHGLINLYVYFLSKDDRIRRSHSKFINTRYIAEMFRVLIHFVPYGINVNLRKLSKGNQNVYATIRSSVNETDCGSIELNKDNIDTVLGHITEMVEDQISYHRVSKERYKRITDRLNKWYKLIFGIGFASIILRSAFQFAIAVKPIADFTVLGMTFTNSIISSLANMIAMLLPAWAALFLSKMDQCSYRYNYENHMQMEASLTEELERLKQIKELSGDVLIEALSTIAENLAQTMLVADTGTWHSKMKTSGVKHL